MTTELSPRRADGWTAAVRQRLGLGRLLPLGGATDGIWIAETAAASVLRAEAVVPGAVLGALRIGPSRGAADRKDMTTSEPTSPPASPSPSGAVPGPVPPPGALPPGPLRIEAEFRAAADRPLPGTAATLRAALVAAAAARLGLEVAEVDLRVTALLEDGASDGGGPSPDGVTPDGGASDDGDAPDQVMTPSAASPAAARADGPVAEAAARVPGVVSLTRTLGSPVHTAADHIRVEVATAGDHRALDVARSVRTAVSAATADGLPVSVLVTDVAEPPAGRAR
ncbi:hypothetical protein FHX79_111198 [Streptomyces cavourensis]|uniref:hypothetical protein n=1 Tax=Streptomyces TaxID=1883 RepID=UPI001172C2A3|nr:MULTISPECIES: hypothetical protein [Streptomyces]NUV78385.1 hypothetical protein [Streptomyces sp. CAI-155]TQO29390.1 hypothetical protein FHX79_111198 [Streptomyces cavourensis]GGU86402.1 hypothetical protein GCM10010498_50780 [Streptomyces cavourensis]